MCNLILLAELVRHVSVGFDPRKVYLPAETCGGVYLEILNHCMESLRMRYSKTHATCNLGTACRSLEGHVHLSVQKYCCQGPNKGSVKGWVGLKWLRITHECCGGKFASPVDIYIMLFIHSFILAVACSVPVVQGRSHDFGADGKLLVCDATGAYLADNRCELWSPQWIRICVHFFFKVSCMTAVAGALIVEPLTSA